jgi:hypothetical protein
LARFCDPGCEAVLDRISDQVRIIETGLESFGFRRSLETSNSR